MELLGGEGRGRSGGGGEPLEKRPPGVFIYSQIENLDLDASWASSSLYWCYRSQLSRWSLLITYRDLRTFERACACVCMCVYVCVCVLRTMVCTKDAHEAYLFPFLAHLNLTTNPCLSHANFPAWYYKCTIDWSGSELVCCVCFDTQVRLRSMPTLSPWFSLKKTARDLRCSSLPPPSPHNAPFKLARECIVTVSVTVNIHTLIWS